MCTHLEGLEGSRTVTSTPLLGRSSMWLRKMFWKGHPSSRQKGASSTTCACILNGMLPTYMVKYSAQPKVQLVAPLAPFILSRWPVLMHALSSHARSCHITTIWDPGSSTPGSRRLMPRDMLISCSGRENAGLHHVENWSTENGSGASSFLSSLCNSL